MKCGEESLQAVTCHRHRGLITAVSWQGTLSPSATLTCYILVPPKTAVT